MGSLLFKGGAVAFKSGSPVFLTSSPSSGCSCCNPTTCADCCSGSVPSLGIVVDWFAGTDYCDGCDGLNGDITLSGSASSCLWTYQYPIICSAECCLPLSTTSYNFAPSISAWMYLDKTTNPYQCFFVVSFEFTIIVGDGFPCYSNPNHCGFGATYSMATGDVNDCSNSSPWTLSLVNPIPSSYRGNYTGTWTPVGTGTCNSTWPSTIVLTKL